MSFSGIGSIYTCAFYYPHDLDGVRKPIPVMVWNGRSGRVENSNRPELEYGPKCSNNTHEPIKPSKVRVNSRSL